MSEQTIEQPRDDAGRFTQSAAETFRGLNEAAKDRVIDAVDNPPRPLEQFTPMPEAPKPERETFRSDAPGLREAARHLQEHRQAAAPPIERVYQDTKTHERRPSTETISAQRGARDLTDLRRAQNDAAQTLANIELAEQVDQFRKDELARERGEPTDLEQVVKEAEQQLQPQPTTPEAPPANGVDPEIAKALENPKIRAALEQEATAHATARQQYLQSVQALGNAAWANVIANFPEMQQGNPQQVLEQMRLQNPSRFAEITGHLQRVGQIGAHWQQLRAQQQQQQAQQFEVYSKAQDQEYTDYENTRPAAEVKQVRERLLDVLRNQYHVDQDTLGQLWRTNPLVRSSQFQRLVYDAVAYQLARESAGKRGPANAPAVMRPGANGDFGFVDNSGLAEKFAAFKSDPTPRSAAAALMARRRAAASRR